MTQRRIRCSRLSVSSSSYLVAIGLSLVPWIIGFDSPTFRNGDRFLLPLTFGITGFTSPTSVSGLISTLASSSPNTVF